MIYNDDIWCVCILIMIIISKVNKYGIVAIGLLFGWLAAAAAANCVLAWARFFQVELVASYKGLSRFLVCLSEWHNQIDRV